ncbi:MAG TPA: acetyl-CoA carboxylase biotin carboxylase subunit [Planctomycetota bacterium]|jgi:acetyl-CoA carboxylase biotin carboxylase subunit|nr:acetyl-CoA carboxylase biotin carboxylase subunit [Planctomycetota bacterium]
MFRRILIANRGEIALRIIRTAREMGIECVAVCSDVDAKALHTRMAHVAVPLGGRLPSETYLSIDKILDAAKKTGAEAIHPGYGFLSENAKFARAVRDAGLAWVGPPPEAIEAMGDKIQSRRAMKAAGVPIVPGIADPLADAASAKKAADGVGYPIALKAAAGGGGKGIRVVREPAQMESAFRTASSEAKSAFGDGRLYLERYLDSPRHIEIQVLFDAHGHGVHLGERECSIQRRHQKLLEECPSIAIDAGTREKMGATALQAARAVGYRNAGTVEFLHSKGEFFFLEMNTRLQVEHPVTEMVTGLDLVREQLRIAAGEPLAFEQKDVAFRGWAIEVRLNAEDTTNGFLPSTGTVQNLRMPGGPGIRLDLGLYRGMVVGVDYDPLLAKVVAWAETRDRAIARMIRALQELNVGGVRTSAPAALAVLEDPRFQRGEFDTHLLETIDLSARHGGEDETVAAAAAIWRHDLARRRALSTGASDRSAWLARSRTRAGGKPD